MVFYSIMIYIITTVSRGEPRSIGASLSASMRRLPANIGATLLLGVVVFIGFVIAFVPILIAMAGTLARGTTLAQVVARMGPAVLVSYLVLLIPPRLRVSMVRMMLYMVPLVAESQGPVRSVAMSWRLVGGNWWRTLTLVGVMAIIVYVLTIVVLAIAGGIGGTDGCGNSERRGDKLSARRPWLEQSSEGCMRVVSGPLMAALFVSIYLDLQLRKGGGDLEARLGALPKG